MDNKRLQILRPQCYQQETLSVGCQFAQHFMNK